VCPQPHPRDFYILSLLPPETLHIILLFSKDVRLPQQLQRAMAAEAEATREARAKVSEYNNNAIIQI